LRQERLYRTNAIVLREMDYAEADRILTLLTPEGRVSALAKGVRRPTSRKAGHLGLFSQIEAMLARGRNFRIITQAECHEPFDFGDDLRRFTCASYVAELAVRFSQEEEESSALFDLVAQGLDWCRLEDDLDLWMRYFELRLLAIAGYQPELHDCVICQTQLEPVASWFSAELGGMVCPSCGTDQAQLRQVGLNVFKVLRHLSRSGTDAVRGLRFRDETHMALESLLQHYLQYILERELKSPVFMRRLRREPFMLHPQQLGSGEADS